MTSRRTTRGFTFIEVLIVITITTVGFVALLNLQIGTLHTASAARDMQEGINLAEHVAQTMHMEALQWTPTNNITGIVGLKFLNNAPTNLTEGGQTDWLIAYPAKPGQKDSRVPSVGNDTTYDGGILKEITGDVKANFCVHYRFTWLVPDLLLRADIRVLWPRNQSQFTKYSKCPIGMEAALHDINMISTPISIIRNVFVSQV